MNPPTPSTASGRAQPLSVAKLDEFRRLGHLTVPGVFSPECMEQAIADAKAWGDQVIAGLTDKDKRWYLEQTAGGQTLRKLDNPIFHRPFFRALAGDPALLALVESILGPGVSVYFSQIFFKPPGGGGPKPVHQDNYYFGPNHADGTLTAWIALDEATIDNGCLFFGEGSNLGPVYPHIAPADQPFNLQVPPDIAAKQVMTPAPVPRGGVSFHHGNTFHQSSDNRSANWRRAAALHYVSVNTVFDHPALPYDNSVVVRIS